MAFKEFELPDIGTITIFKRKASRSMRLSITGAGKVRVTIPPWVPYQSGLAFAKTRADWIADNQSPLKTNVLQNGQAIGKSHQLRFAIKFQLQTPTTRLSGNQIIVQHPATMDFTNQLVQSAAQKACIRALRQEAEELLPGRLRALAAECGFTFNSVSVKQLTRRWGSCDQDQNIVLNLFLMQLPWKYIDYVLLHELVHTVHLHHGANFWATFVHHNPEARRLKQEMRTFQPVLSNQFPFET